MTGFSLGKRIAPPRFVLFMVVLAVGLAVLMPTIAWARGVMAAFDLAALVFLVAISPALWRAKADRMRQASIDNDANRVLLLALTGILGLVILVAVTFELRGKADTFGVVLVLATLSIAWLFSNVVYALHYAHVFYLLDYDGEGDRGGLHFPGTKEPHYWDFVYFSFTLGMTFQTSDVDVTSTEVRRIMVGHCLAAFIFNIGIFAFTINLLGGGSGGS